MTHRYHPDPDRPEDAEAQLLYDDCEDCARKADLLIGLDYENCRKAVDLIALWRDGMLKRASHTEMLLIRRLAGAAAIIAKARA